jgi:hypothetical protein
LTGAGDLIIEKLIVCVSVEHKNTEKVAKSRAKVFGADLIEAKDFDPQISRYMV